MLAKGSYFNDNWTISSSKLTWETVKQSVKYVQIYPVLN